MNKTKDFFDLHANNYKKQFYDKAKGDESVARIIESKATGRILCVGGLWPGIDPQTISTDLTLLDLSLGMLSLWSNFKIIKICGDARNLPLTDNSFDTIIFPMILHHVVGETAHNARDGIVDVLNEAYRVLSPKGKIIIFDFSVSKWIYILELSLSGLTKRFLAYNNIPLVIMHSLDFYNDVLLETGFLNIEKVITKDNSKNYFEIIRPIIGLPWFAIPRILYPLSPLLLLAKKKE